MMKGEERKDYYLRKKLTDYESSYSTLEKTCLALVWARQRLRHYPQGLFPSPVGKDGSKYLFEKPALTCHPHSNLSNK